MDTTPLKRSVPKLTESEQKDCQKQAGKKLTSGLKDEWKSTPPNRPRSSQGAGAVNSRLFITVDLGAKKRNRKSKRRK